MSAIFLAASGAGAIALAASVIADACYDTDLPALIGQVLFIAVPTLAPFAVLCATPRASRWWPAVASIVGSAWAYVVYLDTRPYVGGGASSAPLIGWFGCAIASLVAVLLLVVDAMVRSGRN